MWQRRTKQQVMPRGLLEQVRLWRAVSRLGNRAICDRFARRNKNEDLTRVNRLFIPDFVWWANFERRANGARGKNAPQAVEQLCPISFSVSSAFVIPSSHLVSTRFSSEGRLIIFSPQRWERAKSVLGYEYPLTDNLCIGDATRNRGVELRMSFEGFVRPVPQLEIYDHVTSHDCCTKYFRWWIQSRIYYAITWHHNKHSRLINERSRTLIPHNWLFSTS